MTAVLYILLKALAFPPTERLWALEPDFQYRQEKAQICACFLLRSALSLLLRSFFFALLRFFFGLALASTKTRRHPPLP
jgi:hypothetical protein